MGTTIEAMGERDNIRALVAAAVKRKREMFQAYPAWRSKELIDHCMGAALEAAQTCDTSKASLSTWVSLIVGRRLLDLARGLGRERERERAFAINRDVMARGTTFEDVDESLPVQEYIGHVRRMAEHTVGRKHMGRAANGGRRGMTPAQQAALAALKRRTRWSSREVISYLSGNPSVVSVIGLKSLPHYSTVHRLCCKLGVGAANNGAGRRMAKLKKASQYITEEEAASLCGVAKETLVGWRTRGKAKFTVYRPGGYVVRYKRTEVLEYMEGTAHRPTQNT